MSWTQEEAEQAFVDARKKAMTDKEFRELVLSNPHEAIEQVTGKAVPEQIKIKVIEADPAYHLTFLLPEMVSDELSDEELESVAGGVCSFRCGAYCCPTELPNIEDPAR